MNCIYMQLQNKPEQNEILSYYRAFPSIFLSSFVGVGLGVPTGTLKTREWKTDHEKYGGGKRGTGKRWTKFSWVEKAGPPSMERETDKYRIETLANITLYATTML